MTKLDEDRQSKSSESAGVVLANSRGLHESEPEDIRHD